MKITFPYWGNYTIAFEKLAEALGFTIVSPTKTNPNSIEKGAKISPEMYCFPLKTNLGNFLEAIERGADTIIMPTALGGSCRLRYYAFVQDKVLKEQGKEVNFIIFDQSVLGIYSKIKEISGKSFFKILNATFFFYQTLKFIEQLEKTAQFLRPRETKKGEVDIFLNNVFLELKKIKNLVELSQFKREIFAKIDKINYKKVNVPRVGIVGEIYTVTDYSINFEIEKKLGFLGIEVFREMSLLYHLKKRIFPWIDWKIQKKIKPYLGSTVGGHGRDAIYETLKYAKDKFDGVIQILPAMCMPETTVRPILEKIHQETGLPFLSLSIDEQVAEAGIDTRIEAFVDVVKMYYEKRKK